MAQSYIKKLYRSNSNLSSNTYVSCSLTTSGLLITISLFEDNSSFNASLSSNSYSSCYLITLGHQMTKCTIIINWLNANHEIN